VGVWFWVLLFGWLGFLGGWGGFGGGFVEVSWVCFLFGFFVVLVFFLRKQWNIYYLRYLLKEIIKIQPKPVVQDSCLQKINK